MPLPVSMEVDGFINTIEDDQEVEIVDESSESDEDAVKVEKKPRFRGQKAKEFSSMFKFDQEFNSTGPIFDPLDYVKKKRVDFTSIDEKIEERRLAKRKEAQIEDDELTGLKPEPEVDLDADVSDEEEDLQPNKQDTVRDKGRLKKKKDPSVQEYDERIDTFDESLTFAQMNLSRPLMKAVSALNFSKPTPIQAACIPVALKGRDICACAVTGSGKTAAFILPILERLMYKPKHAAVTRVLICLPTRELALQVHQVCRHLGQHTRVTAALAVGGMDGKKQEAALRMSPDIIIATPGRMIDHLHNTPSFSLDSIEILVLDEADRMLDHNFKDAMTEIIRLCSKYRQTMLFSATMTEEVRSLAMVSLDRPVRVFVNDSSELAFGLRQEFIRIRPNCEADREAIIVALVKRTFHERVMVFIQTKVMAHRMHIVLGLMGLRVSELHGNLNQRQRLEALQRFKDGEVDILIATDVAARGLDIADVRTVINLTMPPTMEHYVHRVGRTARAGKSGRSITLVGERERKLLKEVVKKARGPSSIKSRVVPNDVVEKFSAKIKSLEKDVVEIMREEQEEKALLKAENQLSKADRLLSNDGKDDRLKRAWFQSHQERVEIQAGNRLEPLERPPGSKAKRKKMSRAQQKRAVTAEDRSNYEVRKAQAFASREAKRGRKEKKIRFMDDEDVPPAKKPKGRSKQNAKAGTKRPIKSSFDDELTRVDRTSVRGFRYRAQEARKEKELAGKRQEKFQRKMTNKKQHPSKSFKKRR